MSEARKRGLTQSQSSIFSASPSPRYTGREIPQTQSKIFQPPEPESRPMTFAREQYHKSTISFGPDSPQYSAPKRESRDSKHSPAGKKLQQNSSTTYLLGDNRSTFFRKSVDDHFGVPKDFEPKYANDSAFDRKQKELYNGYSPSREEESPSKQENPVFSARERKTMDRVSVFDTNNYRPPVDVPKENTKPPAYNPNMRKNEILGSNVFGEKKTQEYSRRPQTGESENNSVRRKNHLYSDLFGLNTMPSPEKPSEKLHPNSHFLSTSSKPNPNYDPKNQLYKNMTSSIEMGDSPSKACRNRPMTPQASYTPRFQDNLPSASQMKQQELSTLPSGFSAPSKAELHDLVLNSVPQKYTAPEIKEFCGGVHVVSLVLDIDNFTGTCKGTGRLKVRTNEARDLDRIENVFKAKGIVVRPHLENVGKKTNYSDISSVSWDTPYEYRRTTTPGNAREVKMKNLESAVFEGQQKWVDRKVESVDQELRAQMQWKNTKTAARALY